MNATVRPIVLQGPELRARSRRIRWTRHAVQAAALLLVAGIGWEFVGWVRALESGAPAGVRPPGVEAFLPLAALLALRHLIETGTVHAVHPAALVILLAIVGTSLLLKKAFCSWICPVGALSEALEAAGLGLFRRRVSLPRWLDVPLRGLKYVVLLFFVHAIFVAMSPWQVADFLASPFNVLADVRMLYFFERLSPSGVKVLGALALASLVVPYAWCRYLCPYGALLGVTSLLSPLKVTRDAANCIDCGLCTKACPARLPVERLQRVRSDECFSCLSCVAACPVPAALNMETPRSWRRPVSPRAFAAAVLVVFFGALLVARAFGPWSNGISNAAYAERMRGAAGHP